jgi:hypothetical protein
LDVGVGVEVAVDDFAVVFSEDESIEPEFVVFAVGEPGAGFGLFVAEDAAGDLDGPGFVALRDLLCDGDALAWGEAVVEVGHGSVSGSWVGAVSEVGG